MEDNVQIALPDLRLRLPGQFALPENSTMVVAFAHGSGSGRNSPRNQFVAEALNEAGLGTLLFDLLTPDESEDRLNVFNIQLLAYRLELVTDWLRAQAPDLRVGYFGASTGAAAALQAASEHGADVAAVVSRGGRPDLAADRLGRVRAPTLLIVGGDDTEVVELNAEAMRHMEDTEVRLEIVPGATHLFKEPGALEAVAALARDWFITH
ncbi:alpha/beta fold hydrolase [Spongiactinospora sp. TRM90649]|uniref:dienelactone hydrolase family protein n=1 Tax=Spongiactinospora sp. TRM90649 TaxID=3031114 RepID=UPI0023F718E5|nr:alpha/beta fold hydrolase [Spongiactinospora sp. TRM90649]MDF5752887.1 alpha/beta fold hydrolase [Spongiactinospora sp. TRM90649]